ncbi:transposase [Erwinia tracheiphila PSU-1]|nr:transposase [Erwinia tracheiphila PSU-1]
MTDTGGLPLSRGAAAADRHDIKLVADTPGALQTGRPGAKNRTLPGQRRRSTRAKQTSWAVVTSLISRPVKRNEMPAKPRASGPVAGPSGGRTAG